VKRLGLSAGYPPGTQSRAFTLWSDVKRHFFAGRGPVLLFAFLAFSAVFGMWLVAETRRLPAGTAVGGVCLIGAAITEVLIAAMCDSMDTTRHSMIFFAMFDAIMLGCVCLVASLVSRLCNRSSPTPPVCSQNRIKTDPSWLSSTFHQKWRIAARRKSLDHPATTFGFRRIPEAIFNAVCFGSNGQNTRTR
jgi:hypothetical protein